MSKLKTNSSAKKRFRTTSSKKVKFTPQGKRHGMRKRSNDMLRDARGMQIMKDCDAHRVKKHLLHI